MSKQFTRAFGSVINKLQRKAIQEALNSAEEEWFLDKIDEIQKIINEMPRTYETDGQGDNAVAYLHYFTAQFDWYITEMDISATPKQCFGLVKMQETELGYIDLMELVNCGAELDLHWTPKPLKYIP